MSDQTSIDAAIPRKLRRNGHADRRFEGGPHSRLYRRGAVGHLSGRSWQAKYLKTVEAALIQHVGSSPSVAERLLISRLARISLRLTELDEKIAAGRGTDFDVKVCSGCDGALRNGLARLGFKGAEPKHRTLAEILADIDDREEATA
jgi:hypothetical protein